MTETRVVSTKPNPAHVAYEIFSGKYFMAVLKSKTYSERNKCS